MHYIQAVNSINNTEPNNTEFSEAMLSSLLSLANSIPGIAYWKSTSGIYLWHNDFNQDHKIIFKLNANVRTIVGKTDYDIFSQNIADQYRREDLEIMVSKNAITKEEIFYDKYNTKNLMFFHKRPMLDKLNNPIGIIGNIINITNFDNQNNTLSINNVVETYNSILQPLKEIILLLNLIETTYENNNILELLSEINIIVKNIFDDCNKKKYNILDSDYV